MNHSATGHHPGGESHVRFAVLDGWRAVSILLVLGAHMLPLGPARLRFNYAAGVAGMSCFFTLSGFLILTTIFKHPMVSTFLVRRLFRIVPIAYLTTAIYLLIQQSPWSDYLPHFAFYVNYDSKHLTHLTSVYWSLCIEVQFYVLAAVILATAGLRGFLLMPLLGLGITAVKIHAGVPHAIAAQLRADEILVGTTLGLIWLDQLGRLGRFLNQAISAFPYYVWGAMFAVSSLEASGPLQYTQPYLAAAMIGTTLLAPRGGQGWLTSRLMRYIADISYALYLIHPGSMAGWLGSGDKVVKYMKRPLSFLILFSLAHLSTFHFERRFIALGKRICRKIEASHAPKAVEVTS